jgi:predicted transcriptional regulator
MTNLAGRSGINYKRCVKYVNLLRVLGLIEVIYDNGYFVVVTKRGIEISETVGDGLSFR